MPKRFTDSDKWKNHYFKSLSTVNKLFFLYILDDCDNAGVWHLEPEVAELRMGEKIDVELAKKQLGKHIYSFDNDEKWFLPMFVVFQYGELNPSVNAHKSVITKLNQQGLMKKYQQFIKSSLTLMDKVKDKNKVKDKDKNNEFEDARLIFPGKKRGYDTELEDYCKKHKDWKKVLPLLFPAIEYQKNWREDCRSIDEEIFIEPWKNFKTWLSQRCWEMDMGELPKKQSEAKEKTVVKMCLNCGGTNEEPPTINPMNDVCPICTAEDPDDYFHMHDRVTAMDIKE